MTIDSDDDVLQMNHRVVFRHLPHPDGVQGTEMDKLSPMAYHVQDNLYGR